MHGVHSAYTNLAPSPASDIALLRNCKAQFCLPFPVGSRTPRTRCLLQKGA